MGIRDEGKNTKSIRKGNTIKVEVKTKTGVKNYIGKYLSQDTNNIYIIGYC